LTDIDILQFLSETFTAVMFSLGLKNSNVLKVTLTREAEGEWLDMFSLVVPRRLCLWLLNQLELMNGDIGLHKAKYAKSLSQILPYRRQSLFMQGMRWTTVIESLLPNISDLSDVQEKER
jgi:hypothetical protein